MLLRTLRDGFAMLFCLCLCGCPQPAENQTDEQKNPHYVAGKEKLRALDYKGAIESFERAVESNPRSALAHYELGVLYDMRENDYAAALYHYNKALKLRPVGYPAGNISQRIPSCKQELVKADSLDTVNPTMLRETARLRDENAAMRKQIEALTAQLAARPLPSNPPGTPGVTRNPNPLPESPLSGSPTGAASRLTAGRHPSPSTNRPAGGSGSGGAPATAARSRTHTVKPNETPTSIARSYGVRLDGLLAANPGVDARKLKVGQALVVPGP
jgi:LysM repeat protein